MTDAEREALATVALLAALADGVATPSESTKDAAQQALSAALEKVRSGAVTLESAVGALSTDELRRSAFETAVWVCHVDGGINAQEAAFLDRLQTQLGIDAVTAASLRARGATLVPAGPAAPSTDTLDTIILDRAILAGALELLPSSLASLAVVPLQAELVYRIGQRHGQQLDAAQVKDLTATLGLGVAAQVMGGWAQRIVGATTRGVLGRILGGVVGGAASMATGVAATFATTYALGQVAERYYGQSRTLSQQDLRELFARLRDEANGMYPKVEERIRARATGLDLDQVVASLRGG